MMKSFLITILFLGTTALHALEIDEKLTLRFLKVSNSKKTILINRGAEDGLAVGDHAKFFITSGVIARGVVEKVSPSRSIWSLYRVVDPAEITDGKVLNLKIATPVKITEDPSKSLKEEPIPGGTDKMDMNAKVDSKEETEVPVLDESDKKELEGLGIEEEKPAKKSPAKNDKAKKSEVSETSIEDTTVVSDSGAKNWEVWGNVQLNSLSGTTTDPTPTATQSTDAYSSDLGFALGIEKYFSTASSDFWKNISGQGFVRSRTMKYETNTGASGSSASTLSRQYFEYGGGVSYHFINHPSAVNKFILFGNVSGGLGKITQNVESSGTATTTDLSGTDNFFSIGLGSKYYLSSGWGARALLEYCHVSESYDIPATASVEAHTLTRELSGARLELGISYRF